MKLLMIILMALLLNGCVSARYSASEAEGEEFKMTSFFKSVDGLYTEKGEGRFNLKIDKTHTQDPMGNMLEIMKMLQGMQLAAPPPVTKEQ